MNVARKLYESKGWQVIDKSNSHPFDLLATKESEKRFIEVKGTTGDGCSIILTHGEVEHVRNNRRDSALVIVSGILISNENGSYSSEHARGSMGYRRYRPPGNAVPLWNSEIIPNNAFAVERKKRAPAEKRRYR